MNDFDGIRYAVCDMRYFSSAIYAFGEHDCCYAIYPLNGLKYSPID